MANEQTIRSIYETVGTHDVQKFLSFFAEDGKFIDKSMNKTYRGKNELKGMFETWLKGLPDVKLEVSNVFGSGEEYCVEFSLVGTHKGPLQGPGGVIPASNKKINVPSCDVVQMKGDKIQSISCYLEAGILMEQIGAMAGKKAA